MQISFLSLSIVTERKFVIASLWLVGLLMLTCSISLWAVGRVKTTQKLVSTEPVKVLHFTLTPLGINPSAVTVPEGLYVIEVTNRSDLSRFSLNLGDLSSHKLQELDTTRKHGEWSGFFRLKSDDFVLTVNEKTEWTARLQVIK